MRSRVRTRTHGSVGRRELRLPLTRSTGRLLVEQLLIRGQNVKAIVRSSKSLPEPLREDPRLSLIHASISELSDSEIAKHVDGCDAVASCLGHNLTFKGLFGRPRRLVNDTARRLCNATQLRHQGFPTKFVLMDTTGNCNRDLNEPISFVQKCVIGFLVSYYLRMQITRMLQIFYELRSGRMIT